MRGKALAIINAMMPGDHYTPIPIRLAGGYQLAWMSGQGPVVWGPTLSARRNAMPSDEVVE